MTKRRTNPLITVLLCAFAAVVLTIIILWFFVGYRYISDSAHGIKFLGLTENSLARDGKLYYSNGAKGTLDSETSTILLDNGEQYTGDLSGFLPHGKGILKKADGTVYDGEFDMGSCTGIASITYKTGDKYEGEVDGGKRHGFGTYTVRDGATYSGYFTENQKNGRGKSTFGDGSVYIGEYKNSIKDGFGAYLFKNGDIYVGQFKDDKRTGQGIYIWAKSEDFSSEFDSLFNDVVFDKAFAEEFFKYFSTDFPRLFSDGESLPELQSTLSFWQNFEKILTRNQVECYVGEFLDNLLSGKGTYKWLSGRVLKTEFENGEIKRQENSDTDA